MPLRATRLLRAAEGLLRAAIAILVVPEVALPSHPEEVMSVTKPRRCQRPRGRGGCSSAFVCALSGSAATGQAMEEIRTGGEGADAAPRERRPATAQVENETDVGDASQAEAAGAAAAAVEGVESQVLDSKPPDVEVLPDVVSGPASTQATANRAYLELYGGRKELLQQQAQQEVMWERTLQALHAFGAPPGVVAEACSVKDRVGLAAALNTY
eukprot:TRINITY_DN7463_c0_g1_i1.p1 TRINITY_DN7463_c0_g1~~TRINITY_DN7463_c0_g1_i1.p1  ORF type:complete len:213 (-),score=47.26 TRINITY_DN7463_c0_g1_i1:444-1082(-)